MGARLDTIANLLENRIPTTGDVVYIIELPTDEGPLIVTGGAEVAEATVSGGFLVMTLKSGFTYILPGPTQLTWEQK